MSTRVVLAVVVLAAMASLLLGALGGLRMRRVLESRTSRARTRRGLAAEKAAEKLLVKHGYKVIARQVEGTYVLEAGDATYDVKLTADYLVARGGRELVVEVKTGDAARLTYSETRRQMLEYQMAFGVPAILLVDADAESVREVRFPLEAPRPRQTGAYLAVLLALGGLAAWFMLARE